MTPMPPIDVFSFEAYDLLCDVTLASIMVAVLLHLPLFTMFAPECISWSKANDFNNRNPTRKARTKEKQKGQRRIMARVRAILRAIWSFGGHAMIENPAHSRFWEQDFCDEIEAETPDSRT